MRSLFPAITSCWEDYGFRFTDCVLMPATRKLPCAFGANAVEKLVTAIKRGKIKDKYSLRSLALSSADILFKLGRRDEANEMCDVCISGTNQLLIEYAYRIKKAT